MSGTNVTYDDSQSLFLWTGPWNSTLEDTTCVGCSGSSIVASDLFNGTVHTALAADASGGSCTFTGTAIYIYGVDAPNSASVQFTLDDDASTTQTHQYSGDSIVYDAALYTASGLTNGQHTLSFTVTGVPEGGSLGYVDYAVVTQFHDEPELIVNYTSVSSEHQTSDHHSTTKFSSSMTKSASLTSSSLPTSSSTTESLITAPTESCTSPSCHLVSGGVSKSGSPSSMPASTIIGAVVGSVAGLFMILGGILWYWYRKRKGQMQQDGLPFVGLPSQEALVRIQTQTREVRPRGSVTLAHPTGETRPPVEPVEEPVPSRPPGIPVQPDPSQPILPPAVLGTHMRDLEAQTVTIRSTTPGAFTASSVPILSAPPSRHPRRANTARTRNSPHDSFLQVGTPSESGSQPPPYSGRRFLDRISGTTFGGRSVT